MDFLSTSTLKSVGELAGVGAGFYAYVSQASSKNPAWQGSIEKQFAAAIGNTFGSKVAEQIDPSATGFTTQINPLGMLNKYTIGGIVGYVVFDLIEGRHSMLRKIGAVAKPVFTGLAVGGAVGGFFDAVGGPDAPQRSTMDAATVEAYR